MSKDKENSNWEDPDLDQEEEIIPDYEAQEAIAHSFRTLRVSKTVDGRVIISASTPKKDN